MFFRPVGAVGAALAPSGACYCTPRGWHCNVAQTGPRKLWGAGRGNTPAPVARLDILRAHPEGCHALREWQAGHNGASAECSHTSAGGRQPGPMVRRRARCRQFGRGHHSV